MWLAHDLAGDDGALLDLDLDSPVKRERIKEEVQRIKEELPVKRQRLGQQPIKEEVQIKAGVSE